MDRGAERGVERRKIRICQFTPCLWSGGTEERIARVLAAMDRSEFDLAWMGFGPVREALVEKAGPAVRVIPITRNPAGGFEPGIIGRISLELARIRPDVMHIHNWSTSVYGIAAARLVGVPHVIYGVGGRETADPPPPRRRALMRSLSPHVDRFTTVCEFLAHEIRSSWRVPDARVSVLRTGVDVMEIERAAGRSIARERLGIPDSALVIGAISVFRPVKRIPDLIDAVGHLAVEDPRVHLLLVGNPVRMSVEDLRERAYDRGLAGRIHIPGRIEEPASVLHAFDIFVNCSQFEGSSNAIIEAMAARIPVVATRVGGTPELIDDGVNGLLVESENVDGLALALRTLARDAPLRSRLGENGRKRAERRHDYQKMVRSYLELYRSAVKQGRPRAWRSQISTLAGLSKSLHLALTENASDRV